MYVVLLVVDQSEGRHRAGQQPQVAFHTLLRGKRELALMQAVFEVVDRHILRAVEADQVVAVALMVAKKEILAMCRAIVAPMFACDLDRGGLGVFVPLVSDRVGVEVVKYFLSSFHQLSSIFLRAQS